MMGTFAVTETVNYSLLFGDQGKQASLFRFCLQQTKRSLPIPSFISSKQMEVAVVRRFCFPFAEFRKHGDNKWKTEVPR
jgi:hypothetical protein